jgi:protein-L-isoaspartate(D-aspartate) O-methyltransferase
MDGDPRKIELIMKLRNQGIRDMRVLEAIERVPRERFVPLSMAGDAYADHALPIECGQTISQPYVVAFMTDRLKVGKRMKVLEVGTGSGYQTAILSMLSRRVYTVERFRALLADATQRFEALKLSNITSMVGDGAKGWPSQAPFERIIVTAAARTVPQALLDQLAVGGIMVIPVETPDTNQELRRITRTGAGYDSESLLNVRFVPLVEGAIRDA